MIKTSDLKPEDRKYILDKPEGGLSMAALEKRNKAVIEGSIRKYDALRRAKKQQFMQQFSERADAVSTYLGALNSGRTTSPAAKYFGKRVLGELRGKQILSILQDQALKLQGAR